MTLIAARVVHRERSVRTEQRRVRKVRKCFCNALAEIGLRRIVLVQPHQPGTIGPAMKELDAAEASALLHEILHWQSPWRSSWQSHMPGSSSVLGLTSNAGSFTHCRMLAEPCSLIALSRSSLLGSICKWKVQGVSNKNFLAQFSLQFALAIILAKHSPPMLRMVRSPHKKKTKP